MLVTLLSSSSRTKMQQLRRQLTNCDRLRERIWAEEDGRQEATLMLDYLDVRCCGLEINIKAIEVGQGQEKCTQWN